MQTVHTFLRKLNDLFHIKYQKLTVGNKTYFKIFIKELIYILYVLGFKEYPLIK